jgi:hypothetical protein
MSRLLPTFSQARRRAFLAALAECGVVQTACARTGVNRATVYRWRETDAAFAAQFDEASAQAADHIEAEARRRAVDGVDRPVFYRGEQCGTVREYSDNLLALLLKAKKPEYRDSSRLELSGRVALGEMSDEAILAEIKQILEAPESRPIMLPD